MGHTSDLQPRIGSIPGRPNQYILAGFNGHGMPVIFLAAKRNRRDDQKLEDL